jgi:hypothetical protein
MAVSQSLRPGGLKVPDDLGSPERARIRLAPWIALGAIATFVLVYGLANASRGTTAARLVNPNPPQPVPKLSWAGVSTNTWIPIFYVVTGLVIGLMGFLFIRHWRQTGRVHPGWPIFIALSIIGPIGDPVWNWAFYCNYNPNLLHWPVSWSLFNTAPTVEPWWIVLGAYQAFYLGPGLLAFNLHRKFVKGRGGEGSWVRQHPLWTMFGFCLIVGFIMDILMEEWMMNIGIYKYTQIAGPNLNIGKAYLQFIEIGWCGLWTALIAFMMRKDDRGRSATSRWATSVPLLRRMRFGEMQTAFVVILVMMALYGGCFCATRLSGWAHPVGHPYPFRTLKTYDPNGLMQKAGQPGPFTPGTWQA